MACLANSKVKCNLNTHNKQGSALVLTVLTLAFLLVLLSGVTLDRTLRYWLSSQHGDEVLSFFNAQSAHEMAEFELQKQFEEQGWLDHYFANSISLNEGESRYLWQFTENELRLQGIGKFKKSYTLLQSRYQIYQSPADFPLLLITQQLSGDGILQLHPSALFQGIFILFPSNQIVLSNADQLKFILHNQQDPVVFDLNIEEIVAWNTQSIPNSMGESTDFFIDYSLPANPMISDLLLDHIYFTKESIQLDLRAGNEIVELPSIITTGSLEIVARADQTVRCKGLLYCENLNLSQVTLKLEPDLTFLSWIHEHKEHIISTNYRPCPQMILTRSEYKILPQRALGE